MASTDQIANIAWFILYARKELDDLIKSHDDIDHEIAQAEQDLGKAQPDENDQEVEQVEQVDDELCQLRKRHTKKIGKGVSSKTCKRKDRRDYRDKQRYKESRASKKSKRSPSHFKAAGEQYVNDLEHEICKEEDFVVWNQVDNGVCDFCDNCSQSKCVCNDIEEQTGFTKDRRTGSRIYICQDCYTHPCICQHGEEDDFYWLEEFNNEILINVANW